MPPGAIAWGKTSEVLPAAFHNAEETRHLQLQLLILPSNPALFHLSPRQPGLSSLTRTRNHQAIIHIFW